MVKIRSRLTATVTKPGHDLSQPPTDSCFGGLYEISGLVKDLRAFGLEVFTDTREADIAFVFGSKNQKKNLSTLSECKLIIGCVTDLTIMGSIAENSVNTILTQMPHWSSYFPFHTYVLNFTEWSEPSFLEWRNRPQRCIYGGGSRFGRRKQKHIEYLLDNDDLDAIYSSAQELSGGTQIRSKVPNRMLLEQYKATRFGLVLGDPAYEAFGMVTQRPYEYMCCGCIPIFDKDYNAQAVLGDMAIQVANRKEFAEVSRKIEEDPKMYKYLRDAIATALRDSKPQARREIVLSRLISKLESPMPPNNYNLLSRQT